MTDLYPTETLAYDDDDGTMPTNVETLASNVVGHKIVSAEKGDLDTGASSWRGDYGLILTLDNGTKVQLVDTSDCCAYTALDEFLLDPNSVDHIITGIGTTNGYTTWHIYADWGDILKLQIGWSCGNPFYYGYGFDIRVK